MIVATQATGFLFPVELVVSMAVVLYLLSVARWRARARGRPLPPGPRRLPIVGNMFNMPRSRQWLAFRDLGHDLGKQLSVLRSWHEQ